MKHTHHSKPRSIPLDPMDSSDAPAELGCHAHEPTSTTQGLYSESVNKVPKLYVNIYTGKVFWIQSRITHMIKFLFFGWFIYLVGIKITNVYFIPLSLDWNKHLIGV